MTECSEPAAKRVRTNDAEAAAADADEQAPPQAKGNGRVAFLTGITGQVSSISA